MVSSFLRAHSPSSTYYNSFILRQQREKNEMSGSMHSSKTTRFLYFITIAIS